MTGAEGGFHRLDLVDNIHAFNHLAKHAVAPALAGFAGVVQELVVFDVDEKLRGGRVRVHGSGHGNGAGLVAQTVIGLVFNGHSGGLLHHAWLKTTALNHETINDPVENSSVEVTALHILQEVCDGFGRFFGIQFQLDVAVVGV